MKKTEKYFSEGDYRKLKNEAKESANKVLDGIAALKEEGLPTDKETIEKLTETPEALKNFLRDAANNQIGKGYVAPEERSRIYEVYSHLLARIKKRFEPMRVSLPRVPLIFDGDSITIDWDMLDKKAREATTHTIDAEGLEAWWQKVAAVKQAMDDLKQHEDEHKLPHFETNGIPYTDDQGNFRSPTLRSFLFDGGKEEWFKKAAWRYFLKK